MTNTMSAPWERASSWSEQLRIALEDANIPTLLLVLRHLTGDDKWTNEPYRPTRGKPLDDNDSGGLRPEIQDEVRAAAFDAVIAACEGRLEPVTPSPQQVTQMLSCALVEDVPGEYGELLSEEMGFASRDVEMPADAIPEDFRVVIIGAGLSGLCMGMKLAAAGIDFVILEKDEDLGGTWLENVYPGCGVDTPGHLYTFSFAPNPDLTRYFAKRDEVHDYIQRLASESEIKRHIRFNTEVVRARYQDRGRTMARRCSRRERGNGISVRKCVDHRGRDGQSAVDSADTRIGRVSGTGHAHRRMGQLGRSERQKGRGDRNRRQRNAIGAVDS